MTAKIKESELLCNHISVDEFMDLNIIDKKRIACEIISNRPYTPTDTGVLELLTVNNPNVEVTVLLNE